VEEVAAVTIGTVPLLQEAKTWLCLIGCVDDLIASQLFRSMGKLAFLAIGTKSPSRKVFAEGAFEF
jgi:hypothetical protein